MIWNFISMAPEVLQGQQRLFPMFQKSSKGRRSLPRAPGRSCPDSAVGSPFLNLRVPYGFLVLKRRGLNYFAGVGLVLVRGWG